jgi:hypothetical protein
LPHGHFSPEAQAPDPVVAQKVPASIRIPLSIREIIQFAIAQEVRHAPVDGTHCTFLIISENGRIVNIYPQKS